MSDNDQSEKWIVQPPEADGLHSSNLKPHTKDWKYKYYRLYDLPVRVIGSVSYNFMAEAPSRADGKLSLGGVLSTVVDDVGCDEISKAEFVEMCRAWEKKYGPQASV